MAASETPTDVLVVGAGPTGLVLALWLTRLGVNVRIIDKTAEPGTTSRALAVQARTLEFYRQVGIADEVVGRGLEFASVNLWARGEHVARVDLSDMGKGMSPFPFALIFPQDEHERLLIEVLRRAGVEVERRAELVDFHDDGDRVVTHIDRGGVTSVGAARYIAGCDSARSRVREVLGIEFPGGTYERLFYVADVEIRGEVSDNELHVALDEADLLAVFPMRGQGAARLVGTVKRAADDARGDLTWSDVSHQVVERMRLTVERVRWFSTYRVHHRVAPAFARGRAFLLGDAAHIHSPVGGQGMNTGIGDAVNLAWKLAAVLGGRADAAILGTYETERIGFAKRLVATTDRAFTFATRDGTLARHVRLDAFPLLMPRLLARRSMRRFMWRTISQTMIEYRHTPLSKGKAGSIHGGDRLPWVAPEKDGDADNFTPLSSLDWQMHVHGDIRPELTEACVERWLALWTAPWTDAAGKAGFARDAAYLLRPDGYVALADPDAHADPLTNYLDTHGIRPRAGASLR